MLRPVIIGILFICSHSLSDEKISGQIPEQGRFRKADVIENFDNGTINLASFGNEDLQPFAWELNAQITWGASPWSLKLYGNTWKLQSIVPCTADTGTVWSVHAFVSQPSEYQGFGVMDSANVIFYSFSGTQKITFSNWVTVYQGSFPENQWNEYQLPLGEHWLDYFGYLPDITGIVYLNNRDNSSQGVIYFDQIEDITPDLPKPPVVMVNYVITNTNGTQSAKNVTVQFFSQVIDPDSDEHFYYWDFGDGNSSGMQHPLHTFAISDNHFYTVLLKVADPTNKWGYASCRIPVSGGNNNLPVTINFVGDIMLARKYEASGGIIPTMGVQAIFTPTIPYLGDAADITVANLECTFTTHWQNHPTKTICFKSAPANIDGLTYAGIDVVSLANNHIFDYLQPGMEQTISVLNAKGLTYSGAGATAYEAYRPAFILKAGVCFAFVAASNRTGQYNNYQPYLNAGYNKPGFADLIRFQVTKQIQEVKGIADLVVLEWHSGSEYSTAPSFCNPRMISSYDDGDEDYSPFTTAPAKGDIEWRHFAVDHGADLVICHHPHIIHGLEIYKGKLIAHSLGNFTFDLTYPETMPSMILNACADTAGFYRFTVTPVFIDDFIPQRAKGEFGLYLLDHLAQLSKNLNTVLKIDRINVTAEVVSDTSLMQTFDEKHHMRLAMSQVGNQWQTIPLKLDKNGSISSVAEVQPPADYEFRSGRELLWFGNMENEGCTLWDLNSTDEIYCDTVAYAGHRSIQHRRTQGSSGNIVTSLEQRMILPPGTAGYSLCGYMKTLNGYNVTIEVQYFENRTGVNPMATENIGIKVSGDSRWTFYHKQLTVPAGANFIDIRLNSARPAQGQAFSWFDNVGIIAWEEWGSYNFDQPFPVPNDYYYLQVRSTSGQSEIELNYYINQFVDLTLGINPTRNLNPEHCLMEQNFPNPFNPAFGSTRITCRMTGNYPVNLSIYDTHGRLVRTLVDAVLNAGNNCILWDGRNMHGKIAEAGIYFIRLDSNDISCISKCIVIH